MKFPHLLIAFVAMVSSSAAFADKGRLFVKNEEALQVRVDIIQQAKSEILVEYFSVWDDDPSVGGMALLMEAAGRGVKVKVIVDAVASKIPDALLIALENRSIGPDGAKNIEIRFYNPFATNPSAFTHRDHAKLLIIDGKELLTGGRNVGDKYFGVNKRHNYVDLDILTSGPIAAKARNNFYEVWKSELVRDPNAASQLRKDLDPALCVYDQNESSCLARNAYANQLVKNEGVHLDRLLTEIRLREKNDIVRANTGHDWLKDAPELPDFRFLSHRPDQLVSEDSAFLTNDVYSDMNSAVKELNIVSPYFIPTPRLMALFHRLRDRGVNIRVVTNSISSTDQLSAQAGYRSLKGELVKMGIEIHEFRGTDTLHAKAITIDHKDLIICTCNMDPRSASLNREIGLSIHDPSPNGLVANVEQTLENFRSRSLLVAKDGKSLNEDLQLEGVSPAKLQLLHSLTVALPVIMKQL